MSYESFITNNNKLLWSIVNNSKNKYFEDISYELMLEHFDKEELHQELLMKIFSVFNTFDTLKNIKHTTYFTTVCKNHLLTLIQPFLSQKYLNNVEYDLNVELITNIGFKELYEDKCTLNTLYEYVYEYKYKDIMLKILKGDTQQDIANEIGLTRQRVSQIYLEFVKLIKDKMEVK